MPSDKDRYIDISSKSDGTTHFDTKRIDISKQTQKFIVKNKDSKITGFKTFVILLSVLCLSGLSVYGGYAISELSNNKYVEQITASQTAETVNVNKAEGSVIDQAIKYVVGIYIYHDSTDENNTEYSTASGIVISQDGYILTNDHIFSGVESPKILVYTSYGTYLDARFVGGDIKNDLALLKTDAEFESIATFGECEDLKIGETVYSIGCPMDSNLADSVTQGIISGLNRRIKTNSDYPMKVIQTDAAINPGSSGGALINCDGEVIGVNSSKVIVENFEGICFAIPSDTVKRVLEDIKQNGIVTTRAKLGVSYSVVDSFESKRTGEIQGLKIISISASSGLFSLGFSAGDIITKINGMDIKDDGEYLDIIEAASVGDTVSITIHLKEGFDKTSQVKLIEDTGQTSFKE